MMAEAPLFQWSVPCDLCEAPTEHHCNTCGDLLCPDCKTKHRRSRATKHHEIVPYADRKEPDTASTLTCQTHTGQCCEIWCKTCERATCLLCVTSVDHKGHDFNKITDQISLRKSEMVQELEQKLKALTKWEDMLKKVEILTVDYNKTVDDVSSELSNREVRMCMDIKNIFAAFQKQLNDIRNSSLIHHQKQKNALTDGIQQIRHETAEIDDNLRSKEPKVVLERKANTNSPIDPPPLITPPIPVFAVGVLDYNSLRSMFGNLTTSLQFTENSDRDTTKNFDQTNKTKPPLEKAKETPSPKVNTTATNYIQSLINSPSVVSTIKTTASPYSVMVCSHGDNCIWVETAERKLELVDRLGKPIPYSSTVVNFTMGDIDIRAQGEIIATDYSNKKLKLISNNAQLYTTPWTPYGLCCLKNGEILATFFDAGVVYKYSKNNSWNEARPVNKSLFKYPWFVAQNKINDDIYICNKVEKTFHSEGNVVVLDKTCRLKYEYNGHPGNSQKFTPAGICTNNIGHVLIADSAQHRIHILDNNGHFLRYLQGKDLGFSTPYTIATNNEGFVWIGGSGHVTVVKYI